MPIGSCTHIISGTNLQLSLLSLCTSEPLQLFNIASLVSHLKVHLHLCDEPKARLNSKCRLLYPTDLIFTPKVITGTISRKTNSRFQ